MDYEAEFVKYLSKQTSFAWYHDTPHKRPANFGILRISSSVSDSRFQKRTSYMFRCFSSSRKTLCTMAQELEQAIFNIPDDFANIFAASYVGDYRDIDATSEMLTRTITVEFTINE